ncbi:rhomboid family-domain-containing protein [Spinellus fusiger]|nr:rhomboid family-domain-containing protein [Spinellus fusiger]
MDQPSYERTPDASNVFLQLETVPTDHELPAYKPYTQPPAFSTHQRSVEAPGPSRPSHSPYGSNRGPLMRALVGPVRRPWFSWLTGLAMFIVLIYELIKSNMLAGYFIETNPFNIMVGPGFSVLVNLGAKFTPCIRPLPNFTSTTPFSDCFRPNASCTLEELCAFGGFANGVANQSFRFIIPIFLHAGIVHYVINMLTHLRLGADLERALGVPRYMVLYLASGIWGVILSSILSQSMSASMGCSGALFGLIGYMFVDVIVNWKIIPNPVKELMKLFVSTIISLALGLLPGLDNFAHMGRFLLFFFFFLCMLFTLS